MESRTDELISAQQLETDLRTLAKVFKVSESVATTAMGYITKITSKILTPKECHEFVTNLTKTKQPQDLSDDERMLCITLGLVRRKSPFKANATKVGRNAPCPCKSGAKYKNCCLELVKANDVDRFYSGR